MATNSQININNAGKTQLVGAVANAFKNYSWNQTAVVNQTITESNKNITVVSINKTIGKLTRIDRGLSKSLVNLQRNLLRTFKPPIVRINTNVATATKGIHKLVELSQSNARNSSGNNNNNSGGNSNDNGNDGENTSDASGLGAFASRFPKLSKMFMTHGPKLFRVLSFVGRALPAIGAVTAAVTAGTIAYNNRESIMKGVKTIWNNVSSINEPINHTSTEQVLAAGGLPKIASMLAGSIQNSLNENTYGGALGVQVGKQIANMQQMTYQALLDNSRPEEQYDAIRAVLTQRELGGKQNSMYADGLNQWLSSSDTNSTIKEFIKTNPYLNGTRVDKAARDEYLAKMKELKILDQFSDKSQFFNINSADDFKKVYGNALVLQQVDKLPIPEYDLNGARREYREEVDKNLGPGAAANVLRNLKKITDLNDSDAAITKMLSTYDLKYNKNTKQITDQSGKVVDNAEFSGMITRFLNWESQNEQQRQATILAATQEIAKRVGMNAYQHERNDLTTNTNPMTVLNSGVMAANEETRKAMLEMIHDVYANPNSELSQTISQLMSGEIDASNAIARVINDIDALPPNQIKAFNLLVDAIERGKISDKEQLTALVSGIENLKLKTRPTIQDAEIQNKKDSISTIGIIDPEPAAKIADKIVDNLDEASLMDSSAVREWKEDLKAGRLPSSIGNDSEAVRNLINSKTASLEDRKLMYEIYTRKAAQYQQMSLLMDTAHKIKTQDEADLFLKSLNELQQLQNKNAEANQTNRNNNGMLLNNQQISNIRNVVVNQISPRSY